MTDQHPITPSDKLIEQLRHEAPYEIRDAGTTREVYLITAAYRAGADMELDACCKWLSQETPEPYINSLRAARRPNPKSLAEEALDAIDEERAEVAISSYKVIRRALERLQELEGQGDG